MIAVDDDKNELFLVEYALCQLSQFRLVAALKSAEEAVAFFCGQRDFRDRRRFPIPDLVLLDLKMPGLGGFGLLAWLKENLPERPFRVVVLTNSNFEQDEQRSLELGADEFHQKPLGIASFIYLFDELGRKWAAQRGSVHKL